MTEPELVEVHEVARPRLAPVEFVGRLERDGALRVDPTHLKVGDWLLARPAPDSPWRTGRALVVRGLGVEWHRITAICEGDYVYRIGTPTTPSLEERVEVLERELAKEATATRELAEEHEQQSMDLAFHRHGHNAALARVADLEGWLRYALKHWAPPGSDKAEQARAALEPER